MITSDNLITKSIELHLFFMRIMKEHMFFIEASFTPQNFGMKDKASRLREQASNFLAKVVSIANGNVNQGSLMAEDFATKYTLNAEAATSYYTTIPLDTNITKAEYNLVPRTSITPTISSNQIIALNNEAHEIVANIIAFKTSLLNQVNTCSIFTGNYPLLIDHILREARHYLQHIEELQTGQMPTPQNLINEQIFWNNIMAEHSEFIRGLLDPTEKELIAMSNMFANDFEELTKEAIAADQNAYALSVVSSKSLNETEKIKAFKEQSVEGLLGCKIKSIIVPLLADHVLREANHYLKMLKEYRS